MRLRSGELGDQGLDSFLEEVDELGVHEGVVVGDVEDLDSEVGWGVGEAVGEAAFVLGLHDEDEVGPEQEFLGDPAACGGAEAGALDFDSGVVLIERLRRGAAPLIARAEEEELEHGLGLGKESGSDLGGGDPAGFFFSKPTVAILSDDAVSGIANEGGHDAEDSKKGPGLGESGGDFQGGGAAGVNDAVFDEHEGVHRGRELGIGKELLPAVGLLGGKGEALGGIARDDELHGGAAEVTNAIKEDDGGGFGRGHGG